MKGLMRPTKEETLVMLETGYLESLSNLSERCGNEAVVETGDQKFVKNSRGSSID